jgi:DNA-binding MarR family transcriptional regulator
MHTTGTNALSALLVLATDASDGAVRRATILPSRGLSALVLLTNHPGSSVTWLHERLGITLSGTVRLLDELEDLKVVWREKTPGRKETALHVTQAGARVLAQGLWARQAAIRAIIEPLAPDEQEQLTALIAKALAGGSRRRVDADIACRLCEWDVCRPICPLDASVTDDAG